MKLVVAADNKELPAVARRVVNASHQRCRVDWIRNALAAATAKRRTAISAMLETIFAQENKADAEAQRDAVAEALGKNRPKLGTLMESASDAVFASMDIPREHWALMASKNPRERMTREITRRSDFIGFGGRSVPRTDRSAALHPNDEAIVSRVGALMIGTKDEWPVARRDMSLETLARVTDNHDIRLPAVATRSDSDLSEGQRSYAICRILPKRSYAYVYSR